MSYDDLPAGEQPDPDPARDPARAQAREAALRQILEPDARNRLANIRMVRPDLAESVEEYLVGMASQGRLGGKVDDGQLKQLLQSMQRPRRDFRISRV
ncbi:MAG: DNA-binding protein [Nitrosopumilus sp.]|nr:DNA-binding protein [Nitrosopumilus sp.]CAI9831822.1 DNA-binding protein CENSYa_1764 [Nitrosopumilaceae archaeon]MDA7941674.1 DNA-binding protein [Nitrosopumilus sp.]MDA7943751.1 DNA-binding protein [Nitrosopumilus sp.]MDA7945115.1 DNA-binding protein [Nitrosopumilus sp.]